MKKERHILSKGRNSTQAGIDQVIKDLQFDKDRLRVLGIQENWKAIEEKVCETFFKPDHPTHRPACFGDPLKQEAYTLSGNDPFDRAAQNLDSNEKLWLIVTDDHQKFWCCEGFIDEIVRAISEMTNAIKDIYFVSKKYDWLIRIDEYDQLVITGKNLPEKFCQLIQKP
ncbi:hypothetical protein LZZ85_16145 [Terrimonas sp. NA20]|uniref:Uncharacterized protein n=1 Tax=Terrimonas ginsenosidimutans TaxID=2908004 RepID=A0ABS9KU50_9BACT|nr:DUF6756 family protein [Terrimonas ginsenosidimutans]MCG2615827.1 hypothetical protein [Terrimonas ginsenosidimutans]